ncbi:putative cyclin-like protein [Talaromyces proteolyticus]|uniref:Cyclin-like protein n=1 Tax=Talaromyces proteolyticus TaxID=1131652 RepID=A0AAD4PZ76_9EURO|nr:putative cyclin-like protein [Talaromyces proteolyticus]KAH8695384.1 putative cyclin-like protein [Talaromyces proteolyticus]
MPSFYNPGLHGLPPTPPHFHASDKMEVDQPFYVAGQPVFPPRYSQTGSEFIEQYSQATCFVKAAPMNSHSQSIGQLRPGRDFAALPQSIAQPQLGAQQPVYGSIATAPTLPPIRSNVHTFADSAIPPQYRHPDVSIEHRPKEEKPTGGVAAHLDYEIDQMSDFVAEMAQGIVYPGQTVVPPPFRKYVHQILSSTRLPSSTILLGLLYLATRMRMLSAKGIYASGTGQVYRMLTTALLLGSKFLDDNTFQNRSWAEVSNISVTELNSMELDWLFAFEWKIHERIHNKEDGFGVWLARWEAYRATLISRGNPSRQKLAPIDTNITRQLNIPKPLMSPDGPIPPQYQRPTNFENTWLNPAACEYSPPSAPHSGPNTPDYYNVGTWMHNNPPPPYTRSWVPQHYLAASHPPRSQPPSYHHTPVYTVSLSNSGWTGHGSSCGCNYCIKHQEHYFPANTFGSIPPLVAS